jgi:hypothetical protein
MSDYADETNDKLKEFLKGKVISSIIIDDETDMYNKLVIKFSDNTELVIEYDYIFDIVGIDVNRRI